MQLPLAVSLSDLSGMADVSAAPAAGMADVSAAAAAEALVEGIPWMVLDGRGNQHLKAAEFALAHARMEHAKIASEALGPQTDEEKQAMADGLALMLKAHLLYQQAAKFFSESQAKLDETIAGMEKQVGAVESQEKIAKCQECIKTMQTFKNEQKEKLSKIQGQIDSMSPHLNSAVNMVAAEAKPATPQEGTAAVMREVS